MFMYVGALLSLAGVIFALTQRSAIRTEILKQDPAATNVNALVNSTVATFAIVSVLGALLWVWMARANGKGKSWARIVATVLFAFNTLSTITTLAGGINSTMLQKVVTALTWLAGAGAIYYLYRKDAAAFFKSNS